MEIIQILQSFFTFSGVPSAYFSGGEMVYCTPELIYLPRLVNKVPDKVLEESTNASCILTNESLCYGRVRVKESGGTIIFGPLKTNPCDNLRAQRILRKLELPTTEAGQMLSYLQHTPSYSYQKFCNFVLYAHFVLNREDISIDELLGSYYDFKDESPEKSTVSVDQSIIHDSQSYENFMFSMVRFGQYEKMTTFLKNSSFVGNEGVLAADVLRHQKNLINASVTLASRCAVDGGIDYETAMGIADAYIQKVELVPDMNSLSALHKNMLKTYTRMVWEKKHNNAEGGISARTHQYIEQHIAEKLSGKVLAEALGVSRTYLSAQFKRESGINLNDFINQTKIREAKLLLLTTDHPISEIANQLSFCSQAHLHTVFKEVTGVTPMVYRASKSESDFSNQ